MRRIALASGAAAVPLLVTAAAGASGNTDYAGSFGGTVGSDGSVTYFNTIRCDTDGYSVGIQVDSFTASSGRTMNFAPLNTSSWTYQSGGSSVSLATGESDSMGLGSHCWRFAAYVDPPQDTNGGSPGYGTTSFDGQLKY